MATCNGADGLQKFVTAENYQIKRSGAIQFLSFGLGTLSSPSLVPAVHVSDQNANWR